MKTTRFIFLAVIATLYHVVCCIAAEGQTLRYEIITDKDSYRIGENVIVTLRLTNVSTNRVSVSQLIVPGASAGTTQVTNPDGKQDKVWTFAVFTASEQIAYKGPFKSCPLKWTQLEPGKKIDAQFALNPYYDLSKAGTYILKATHFNGSNPAKKEGQMNVVQAADKEIIIVK